MTYFSFQIDRIIFCVFLQKDYSLYNNFLHKYFPLNLVAQVRNEVAEQPLESPPPPPIVPTLQKSVTEPGQPSHTLWGIRDPFLVKPVSIDP